MEETKEINGKSKSFLVMKCPSNDRCKKKRENGLVYVGKGDGFTNPKNHLKSCLCDGKDEALLEAYHSKLEANDKGVQYWPNQGAILSRYDKALYSWLSLIVEKNCSLNIVEDDVYRGFSMYKDIPISIKTLRSTIYALVEMIEIEVAKEMKEAKQGCLMHDGWSKNGTHFVGMMACFMSQRTVQFGKHQEKHDEFSMVLLSVSPLAMKVNAEGAESTSIGEVIQEEAVQFNAEVHAGHFEFILSNYGLQLNKWVKCLVSDGCSVNHRIARLLQKPMVWCKSHLLQLEVKAYTSKKRPEIDATIDKINTLMKKIKGSVKNSAAFRKLTDLRPVLYNATRWSGKLHVLTRFLHVRDQIIDLSLEEGVDFEMPTSVVGNAFRNAAKEYESQLAYINAVAVKLQERGLKLSDAQELLDCLSDDVVEYSEQEDHPLFGCLMSTSYIDAESTKLQDSAFERGVIKIQTGKTEQLTRQEIISCEDLLPGRSSPIQVEHEESSDNSGSATGTLRVRRRFCSPYQAPRPNVDASESRAKQSVDAFDASLARRKEKRRTETGYINCDFICGSTAELERLWSQAELIYSSNRQSMHPMMLDALLFLKFNRRFWNAKTVAGAHDRVKKQSFMKRSDEASDYCRLHGINEK